MEIVTDHIKRFFSKGKTLARYVYTVGISQYSISEELFNEFLIKATKPKENVKDINGWVSTTTSFKPFAVDVEILKNKIVKIDWTSKKKLSENQQRIIYCEKMLLEWKSLKGTNHVLAPIADEMIERLSNAKNNCKPF
jgi:hypothetical protein